MTTKVSNVSTFQVPIHATLNGKPVRLLALGEQEGKSPVYLAVKQDGKSEWESISGLGLGSLRGCPRDRHPHGAGQTPAGVPRGDSPRDDQILPGMHG